MRLSKLYIRFFKSFNLDYERKANENAIAKPWEWIDDQWFPFVCVHLDSAVTAVVGANESGKSHLIDALECALTGENLERKDFCRYSPRFSVEEGEMRIPDFGLELSIDAENDADLLVALGQEGRESLILTLMRLNGAAPVIYGDGDGPMDLAAEAISALVERLPRRFRLETATPIPDGISFDVLLGRDPSPLSSRRRRFDLSETLRRLPGLDAESLVAGAATVAEVIDQPAGTTSDDAQALAKRLLLEVAHIDQRAFVDLEEAIRDEEEGRVDGIIERMNRSLARHLNFSRWWHQDRDFELRLSPRERELAFTISDRTGSEYSFGERSKGLTYFLSYYVQLRAHRQTVALEGGPDRPEVLLMDEPDAFLSALGQQDLLRVFEDFARPERGGRRDQVVYVTHSPFLINKNAAHRVRVLDKGTDEEGTRVVRDATQNHYEPLRTSIGAYVAETAFIGGANLVVEGVTDQILLTGAASLLSERGFTRADRVDLNHVTIVPAGGSDTVPYMVFLARGRGEIRPPCVALLDGDQAGRDAIAKLKRSEHDNKRVLADKFIVDFAEWAEQAKLKLPSGVVTAEPEDLIPPSLAAVAANRYAERFLHIEVGKGMSAAKIQAKVKDADGKLWKAIKLAFADVFPDEHIEKVGFVKELVDYLDKADLEGEPPTGSTAFEQNFGALLAYMAKLLREAETVEQERRRNRRLSRVINAYLQDHQAESSRDDAELVLRDIEASLEDVVQDEEIRVQLSRLRREFDLATDPLSPVENFLFFRERVDNLRYAERLAYQAQGES